LGGAIGGENHVAEIAAAVPGRSRAGHWLWRGARLLPLPVRVSAAAGLDLAKFQSVIIWCEQFSVLISPADLTTAKVAGDRPQRS